MPYAGGSVLKFIMARPRPAIISLFSGILGLDLGLESAGFQIRVAVECNRHAAETIRTNRPDIAVIERRIEDVTTEEILAAANLRPGEPAIVTGGPSCQAFSTAGQRGSLADPRGLLFREFIRVVREAQPHFFVMENVKGIFSAAIRHRPLIERGPGYPPLTPEEELGSAFGLLLTEFQELNYYTVFDLLNAADFGVPQARERVLFMGSRDGRPMTMPEPTHEKRPTNGRLPWVTLQEALEGLNDPAPAYKELSPSRRRYITHIPEGGNWRNLPAELQEEALGKAYVSWGGRSGFFRRLAWNRPSPALTTCPDSKATMLCHPTELRPLSIREYARLQQYDDSWVFSGSVHQQYTQIGNAVPLGIGAALGNEIQRARRRKANRALLGIVDCSNIGLIHRLAARPRTMLNPARMRKVQDAQAAREWLGKKRSRTEFLAFSGEKRGRAFRRRRTRRLTPSQNVARQRRAGRGQ